MATPLEIGVPATLALAALVLIVGRRVVVGVPLLQRYSMPAAVVGGLIAAALAGARRSYPWGRFAGVSRILDEDLRLIAAAWLAQEPANEKTIREELARNNVVPDVAPSLRFVLNWETDANDVDRLLSAL